MLNPFASPALQRLLGASLLAQAVQCLRAQWHQHWPWRPTMSAPRGPVPRMTYADLVARLGRAPLMPAWALHGTTLTCYVPDGYARAGLHEIQADLRRARGRAPDQVHDTALVVVTAVPPTQLFPGRPGGEGRDDAG